jgi:hypothetical protein
MSMPVAKGDESPDLEPLRARLRAMTDAQLLTHGLACRRAFDASVKAGELVDITELRESRWEWLRRKAERRTASR